MGKYAAMTVNERLWEAGILGQFDDAVNSRDKGQIVELLTSVEIDAEEASTIADTILANPKFYGFSD